MNVADVDLGQIKQIANQNGVFVSQLVAFGQYPPMGNDFGATKDADFDIGIADVNGKQHIIIPLTL
jgi:hypothetical protein